MVAPLLICVRNMLGIKWRSWYNQYSIILTMHQFSQLHFKIIDWFWKLILIVPCSWLKLMPEQWEIWMTLSHATLWNILALLILEQGNDVSRWWSPFVIFSIWLAPYCILHHDLIDALFLQKESVFLNDIYFQIYLGLKLTIFKEFVSILFLIFDPIDPPFHWFEICFTPNIYKTLDLIDSNFKFGEVPEH